MSSRVFQADEDIYRQGDESANLFEILSGHVAVVRLSDDGVETLLAIFGPGDCFGEQSLVDGGPRETGARACGTVTLRMLSRTAFDELQRAFPDITGQLLTFVARRLRQTVGLVAEQSRRSLRDRLLRRLLMLAHRSGERGVDDRMTGCDPPLRQADLAGWVGASRQRLNMALGDLQRSGLVDRSRDGRLFIDREAAARALARSTS